MRFTTKENVTVIKNGVPQKGVIVSWVVEQAYFPTGLPEQYAVYSVKKNEDGIYETVDFLDYGGLKEERY